MAYKLTQTDIDSVTDAEVLKTTTRLLPEPADIPKGFWGWNSNAYTRFIDAMYIGEPPPAGEVTFNKGYRPDGAQLKRCINAHLRSIEPEYEHKIAGVAYMLAQVVTIKEQTPGNTATGAKSGDNRSNT